MPRVTLGVNPKETSVKGVLAKYISIRGLQTKEVLAKPVGLGTTKLYKAVKNPDIFTVGQLRALYDYLKVPQEERVGL